MKVKGQQKEANVASSSKNYHRGSTFGIKVGGSFSGLKIWKKEDKKGNKVVSATTQKARRLKMHTKKNVSIATRTGIERETA